MLKLLLLILIISINAYSQTTLKSGRWSDKNIWPNKQLPKDSSNVRIAHTVTFDVNTRVNDLTIIGTLIFSPSKSDTLKLTGNLIDSGRLVINSSKNQFIKLENIDPTKYMGAMPGMMGMDINKGDRGIWIRGQLTIIGAYKTAWTNCSNISMGSTKITLTSKPVGWKIGDTLSITPTDKTFNSFDLVAIKSISGAVVNLTSALKYDHPGSPEVLNLTRNIKLEGGHIHILSNQKQIIQNVEIVNMGIPGKVGRYPLHEHHCDPVSTIISGVVIKYSGNRAFVPHASDSITIRNCIAYGIRGPPYWWDSPVTDLDSSNNTNNLTIDSCVAANFSPDESPYRFTGFEMGAGRGNSLTNSIAVGNLSFAGNGFDWPEKANHMQNVWVFRNNLAHNNANNGINIWQNDQNPHVIENFTAYNNGGSGIELGAYHHRYHFKNINLIGNKYGIFQHALSVTGQIIFENVISTDSLYITTHLTPSDIPVIYINCKFPGVVVNEASGFAGVIEFVGCEIGDFRIITQRSIIIKK